MDIDISKIQKHSNALQTRLEDFNIKINDVDVTVKTTDDDNKPVEFPFSHFSLTNDGDISINYTDINGVPLVYHKKRGKSKWVSNEYTKRFARIRFTKPPVDANGREMKYLPIEKGTESRIYQNGLYQFFNRDNSVLDKITTLFITEGEFKAFVACMHGVPTVGISGIHSFGRTIKHETTGRTTGVVLKHELTLVFHSLPNLQRVVLLHDADALEGSFKRKVSFQSSVRNFMMGLHIYNVTRKNNNKAPILFEYWHGLNEADGKGIDDVFANNDPNAVKADFFTSQSRFVRKHPLNGEDRYKKARSIFGLSEQPFFTPFEGEEIKIKRYVSEKTELLNEMISAQKNSFIAAPTGTGKTRAFLKELIPLRHKKNEHESVAFVVPTTALAQQVSKDYNVPAVYGEMDGADLEHAETSNVCVTTYNSLHKLGKIDLLIVDEAHHLTDEYRLKACNVVLDYASLADHVVFISGTPTAEWKHFGFRLINIIPEEFEPIHVKSILVEKRCSMVDVQQRVASEAFTKEGITFMRLNSKSGMESIKEFIVSAGIGTSEEIAIIHNERKDSDVYASVMNESLIPDHIKLVMTTSLWDDGINILNTNIAGVHFFQDKIGGRVSPNDAIQFMHRFRKWRKDVRVYMKEDDRSNENVWSVGRMFESILSTAESFCEKITLSEEDQWTTDEPENIFRDYFESHLFYFSNHWRQYYVSECGVIMKTLEFFSKIVTYDAFNEALSSYHGVVLTKEVIQEESRNAKYYEARDIVLEKTKRAEERVNRLIEKDLRAFLIACYSYVDPSTKKRLKMRYRIAVNDGNEVTPVLLEIHEFLKLKQIVNRLLDIVDLDYSYTDASHIYLTYSKTGSWTTVISGMRFWRLYHLYKSKSRYLGNADRRVVQRVDALYSVVSELKASGKRKQVFDISTDIIFKHHRSIEYNDLKTWMGFVCDYTIEKVGKKVFVHVNEVFSSPDDFRRQLLGGGVCNLFKDKKRFPPKDKTPRTPIKSGVPEDL